MKVDRDLQQNIVKVTPETREEASYLSKTKVVELLNKYEVEVGSTLVIEKTQWNNSDSITRRDEHSYY